MTMREPYLIQRVMVGPSNRKGIDGFFGFDYMGSSEFEWGAIPKTLRLMRENISDYLTEPKRIKSNGHTAWYVGPDDEEILQYADRFFRDQLLPWEQHEIRFMERTNLHEAYNGPTHHTPEGWWAIDQERPWLLFMKKDHAREWIKRMVAGATRRAG